MAKIDVHLNTNTIFVGVLQYHQCYISNSIRSSSNYLWFCVIHSQVIETGSADPHWLVQLLPRDGNAVAWAFWTEYFTTTPERMRKMKITKTVKISIKGMHWISNSRLFFIFIILFCKILICYLCNNEYLKEVLTRSLQRQIKIRDKVKKSSGKIRLSKLTCYK